MLFQYEYKHQRQSKTWNLYKSIQLELSYMHPLVLLKCLFIYQTQALFQPLGEGETL